MSLKENIISLVLYFVFVEFMVNIVIMLYTLPLMADNSTALYIAFAFAIGNILLFPLFTLFFLSKEVQNALDYLRNLNQLRKELKQDKKQVKSKAGVL